MASFKYHREVSNIRKRLTTAETEGRLRTEKRIYKCRCSNILEIDVHTVKYEVDIPNLRRIYVQAVRLPPQNDPIDIHRQILYGAYIRSEIRPKGHVKSCLYGPEPIDEVHLIHCRRCYTAVGLGKFKKVSL